jgi:hypothetical protein
MHQNGIWIPVFQPLNRALTAVGRAIVSDPKNAPGMSIGWLAHDQINQILKALNAAGRATQTEDPGVENIPTACCDKINSNLIMNIPFLWAGMVY